MASNIIIMTLVINAHVFISFLTGVKCKLGGSPPVLPHLVSVHDDFPAVSLERLHPVFCPNAGGVSLGLLGPQRKPDGESTSTKPQATLTLEKISMYARGSQHFVALFAVISDCKQIF